MIVTSIRAAAIGLLAFGWANAAVAAQDKGHCPDNAAGTFRFFQVGGNTDQDRSRLETLAGMAKDRSGLCILAFIDTAEGGYAKKLAIRRAKWVLDTLTGKGVPRERIAIELRPGAPEQTKDDMKQVQVILNP